MGGLNITLNFIWKNGSNAIRIRIQDTTARKLGTWRQPTTGPRIQAVPREAWNLTVKMSIFRVLYGLRVRWTYNQMWGRLPAEGIKEDRNMYGFVSFFHLLNRLVDAYLGVTSNIVLCFICAEEIARVD